VCGIITLTFARAHSQTSARMRSSMKKLYAHANWKTVPHSKCSTLGRLSHLIFIRVNIRVSDPVPPGGRAISRRVEGLASR
jgi:hypothetical protein